MNPRRFRFSRAPLAVLIVLNFALPFAAALALWIIPRVGGWKAWR